MAESPKDTDDTPKPVTTGDYHIRVWYPHLSQLPTQQKGGVLILEIQVRLSVWLITVCRFLVGGERSVSTYSDMEKWQEEKWTLQTGPGGCYSVWQVIFASKFCTNSDWVYTVICDCSVGRLLRCYISIIAWYFHILLLFECRVYL